MPEGFLKIFHLLWRDPVKAYARLNNQKGQTMVEYMLLLVVAFITSYLMVTGPVANFTRAMIEQIRAATTNIVRSGEMQPQTLEPGSKGHPSDPARFQAEHL